MYKFLKNSKIIFFTIIAFIIIYFFSDLIFSPSVKVHDGDSIKIGKTKYRLYAIDAPELSQICYDGRKEINCGEQSKKFLEKFINGKKIVCHKKSIDQYQRIVAICYANGIDISSHMAAEGWAVIYNNNHKYLHEQHLARSNKKGIWKYKFDTHPDSKKEHKKY